MSSIVLSSSVRQNLLSLQSTASLLATTQNDLATGNKVNSALDNPTSFFTASALNNRAGDISNLLDGIGNGVQVLQAANTGITSLQSLVASAQSIANQVLQTPIGYSAKSSVSTTAITGATANNLLGTATGTAAASNAVATGTSVIPTLNLTSSIATNAVATGTTAISAINLTNSAATHAVATGTTAFTAINLTGTAATHAVQTASAAIANTGAGIDATGGLSFDVNGQTVSLAAGGGSGTGGTYLLSDIVSQINTQVGGTANVAATIGGSGNLVLTSNGPNTGTADSVSLSAFTGTGFDGTSLGFSTAAPTTAVGTNAAPLASLTFDVNGAAVTLAGGSSYTGAQVAAAINGVTAAHVNATVDGTGHLVLTSTATTIGTADQVQVNNFSSGDATQLGFATATETANNGTDAVTHPSLTFNVNGAQVTLATGSNYTGAQIATAINGVAGTHVNATVDGTGHLVLTSTGTAGANDQVQVDTFSSGDATQLGFAAATETDHGTAAVTPSALTFNVNGAQVSLASGSSYTGAQIAAAINTQVGTSAHVNATVDGTGHLILTSTGTAGANDEVKVSNFSSGDATQLGFASPAEIDNGAAATESITGKTLTIASTGGGTATNITFGTASGQISTLNDLNVALSANNLQATIDSTGVLTITTSNNAASSTIGAIGGTATDSVAATGTTPATAGAFAGVTAGGGAPIIDPNAQATRTGLVDQYNNILKQIDTTSQDSSFNGINLLQGDTLNLTFDETGKSTLAIKGVTFNTAGLGLANLTTGTDFLDSNSANNVLTSLTQVSTTLRSEASNLGSNLSIVQIRQDFSKNLINVLQTGASNLTLADTNEEAANSQALSTRQSIAVSALALANQSQQSVLQLLR